MAATNSYAVNPGWRIVLRDRGLNPANVLRRAGLPDDLFAREKASLSTDEYFRLWRAIEDESADPLLPIHIGSQMTVEAFDPPVFAALCSADLNSALRRIAHFKRLIFPMVLHVNETARSTTLDLEWLDASAKPPVALVATELVFFVHLARIATREKIFPLKVYAPRTFEPAEAYAGYFGVAVQKGRKPGIAFKAEDAALPFLTANESMWQFFEPQLQRRLAELDESATFSERTRAALLELLPSGNATIEAVSQKLGTSTRTLQRYLGQEGNNFQSVLNATREELARHYLRTSSITSTEISFLLGFEDPNSFFRAFQAWTGTTPEQARNAMLRAH